ncbi:MAG: DUF1275 domain-containing protein [Bacteroidetes bacterium]|nr:DUF1275 domain-containing protein [Bacteroidota bacterium]
MFRHHGKYRTYKHNLSIASLLSFVAGVVNVVGFLAVQKLTTNVTGHFAYFVDEVFKLNFLNGVVYFLYIFFFFLGAFISSLLVEIVYKKSEKYVYIIPALAEAFILIYIGFFGEFHISTSPDVIVYSLLFAMGLQNSLVTSISNATVRTTHLTGLFTDLGIEIAQLLFSKFKKQKYKLVSSIKLRFTIIAFFFFGGIFGGIFYSKIGLNLLIVAAVLLIIGVFFDSLKLFILGNKSANNV